MKSIKEIVNEAIDIAKAYDQVTLNGTAGIEHGIMLAAADSLTRRLVRIELRKRGYRI